MVEDISMGIKQMVLPYSTLSENRKEPFTADMEQAAIFSLVEQSRMKGGGLISKQAEERIVFIAKIGYPLWLFPWSEAVLIFDGLNRSKYTMPYVDIPNVKVFMENMKRSSKTLETYMAFLSDYLNYFQAPLTEKGISLQGLIRDPEFLSEFESCRQEATEIESIRGTVGLVSSIIDELTISSAVEDLEKLHVSLKEDVEDLHRCMKLANKIAREYAKELRSVAREAKRKFDSKIREEEDFVAPKIAQLKETYDKQIIASARNFEKQSLPIQKERVKLEKTRGQILKTIEHYRIEAKTKAERGDSVGEQKWKEKTREAKKKLSEIEENLKQTEKAIRDFEEKKSLEIFKLRSELEDKIKDARKDLIDLEASRDAKIFLNKQEIETLENQTKLMIDQIGKIAKFRETMISQFEALGVKHDLATRNAAIFYVSFYVACYQVESQKRYEIFPPSLATTVKLTTRLKGAFGKKKIKQLLSPRFYAMASLMDNLQVLIHQSAIFQTEINELGKKTNMLDKELAGETILNGLSFIQKEGWLSTKDFEEIAEKIPKPK